MDECWTVMTVVPTVGNTTAPPLGCGPADVCDLASGTDEDDELPVPAFLLVALLLLVTAGEAAEGAVAGALPGSLARAVCEAGLAAGVESGDPPHAVNSSTREPIPAAAAHPLWRMD